MELANAYNELLDPVEQLARFKNTNKERIKKGWEALPIDSDLQVQISKISQPTAGIALGLERLFMACMGIKEIGEIKKL